MTLSKSELKNVDKNFLVIIDFPLIVLNYVHRDEATGKFEVS